MSLKEALMKHEDFTTSLVGCTLSQVYILWDSPKQVHEKVKGCSHAFLPFFLPLRILNFTIS